MKSPEETHGTAVVPPPAKHGLAEILKKVPSDVLLAEIDRRFSSDPGLLLIHRAVCEICGTDEAETRFHRYRSKVLTPARQMACHLMVMFYGLAEGHVARFYGQHRNSIIHAVKRMTDRLDDPHWHARYRETLIKMGKC